MWAPSRHLGSLTAANWVSFDFKVSSSSCWGYSLINTLKLKKKFQNDRQWRRRISSSPSRRKRGPLGDGLSTPAAGPDTYIGLTSSMRSLATLSEHVGLQADQEQVLCRGLVCVCDELQSCCDHAASALLCIRGCRRCSWRARLRCYRQERPVNRWSSKWSRRDALFWSFPLWVEFWTWWMGKGKRTTLLECLQEVISMCSITIVHSFVSFWSWLIKGLLLKIRWFFPKNDNE